MENSYGIGVRNRYALFLDDESDPIELLKVKEQEKEDKKKVKGAEKENKGKFEPVLKHKQTPVQKKIFKETPLHNKVQEAKREDSKTTHHRTNDGKIERRLTETREERNNRRNRANRQFSAPEGTRDREERPRKDYLSGSDNFETYTRGGRSASTRDGGSRTGGSKGYSDSRRGKREFDRQSGSDKTGVKPVEKREGGGAHNWGSHKDIIDFAFREVDKSIEVDSSSGEVDKNDSAVSVSETKEKTVEPEVESSAIETDDLKELTLDEWKAQRTGRVKPQYNIRKAGEGEDPSQWKKMYELKKKDEENYDSDEEFDAGEYPQRVGRQKHVLDIDIRFSDVRRANVGIIGRGRGLRSSRGRSRGDRRFRGNEELPTANAQEDNEKTPKVDDERDFPSLG